MNNLFRLDNQAEKCVIAFCCVDIVSDTICDEWAVWESALQLKCQCHTIKRQFVTLFAIKTMSLAVLQADCKRAVSSLASLSNDELDAIMNDDERIAEILKGLDQVVRLTHL